VVVTAGDDGIVASSEVDEDTLTSAGLFALPRFTATTSNATTTAAVTAATRSSTERCGEP
jgi:hypothetical protein